MDLGKFFGNVLDNAGTALNLPDFGLSEGLAGNNKTANTGRVGFTDTGGWLNTASSPTRSTVNNAYQAGMAAKQSSPATGRNAYDVADAPIGSVASGYVGGGGAGGASFNPADIAYLDDQEARLRGQSASADRALSSGLTQLNDSYGKEVGTANQNRSRALEDFAVKREDTTRAKDTALNRVDSNARTLADSLRRRIGMASGSGSSAYQFTAPGAVARQASDQRGEVQENYGTNFRNLGQAEQRANVDFESLLAELASQRNQRESDFRSGILDRKNQVDTNLSEIARQRALARGGGYDQVRSALAPYASAIDARQQEIDSLFDRYRTPFNVKAVDVQAPELRDYTTEQGAISEQQQTADPYAEALRKRQLEEDNNVLL